MTREKQIKLYKNTLKIQELLKFAKIVSKNNTLRNIRKYHKKL